MNIFKIELFLLNLMNFINLQLDVMPEIKYLCLLQLTEKFRESLKENQYLLRVKALEEIKYNYLHPLENIKIINKEKLKD